jgi:phosphatidylinositol phospholipase C, delta
LYGAYQAATPALYQSTPDVNALANSGGAGEEEQWVAEAGAGWMSSQSAADLAFCLSNDSMWMGADSSAASSSSAAMTMEHAPMYPTATPQYQHQQPAQQQHYGQQKRPLSSAMAHAVMEDQNSLLQHGVVVQTSPATAGGASTTWRVDSMSDDELRAELKRGASMRLLKRSGKLRDVYVRLLGGGMHLQCGEQSVFLGDIDAIRQGQATGAFQRHTSKLASLSVPDSDCFSLQYGHMKSVDLVCGECTAYEVWVHGLVRLVAAVREEGSEYVYVRAAWSRFARGDKQAQLGVAELTALLAELNFRADAAYLADKIKRVDATGDGRLGFGEFVRLMRALRARPEARGIFDKYARGAPSMGAAELLAFLRAEQSDDGKSDSMSGGGGGDDDGDELVHARQLIAQFGSPDGTIDASGFEALLTSERNSLADPRAVHEVYQDMSQPLNDYFIASSHNTYLEGNQLTGTSSSDMYVRVLKTGCRCVELDCWNGPSGEPIIYHGRTLTSRIELRDVLEKIRDFAFCASEYPLILSIENHCDEAQQSRMAAMLKEVLGDMIAPPMQRVDGAELCALPSPEQLKYRVLLKGPMMTEHNDPQPGDSLSSYSPSAAVPAASMHAAEAQSASSSSSAAPARIDPSLSALMFFGAMRYDGGRSAGTPWRMTSLSELDMRKKRKSELVQFNAMRCSRIYPKGARVSSSNYDPVAPWAVGCQMVALNYQTPDTSLLLNYARFLDNGRCGYVLKPPELRRQVSSFDPDHVMTPLGSSHVRALRVQVISARQLPKPREANADATAHTQLKRRGRRLINKLSRAMGTKTSADRSIVNPYVAVEVHGVKADQSRRKTSTISDNGLNPCWNESMTFNINASPLAIVTFAVYHQEGSHTQKLAVAAVPLAAIRPGFRVIALRDCAMRVLPLSDLFVHIKVNQ